MTRHLRLTTALAFGLLAALPPPLHARRALPSLPAPAEGGVRVVLLRHGQAISNLPRRAQPRRKDPDNLTNRGYWQATEAGHVLRGQRFAAVLVSPARRARQTADKVAGVLGGIRPRVDERLRPMDVGTGPDGRPLDWKERESEWKKGRDPSPPGGESLDAVGRRITALVQSLPREKGGQAVLLVSHNEVISSLLGLIEGRPPLERFPPGVENASVSVVDVRADGTMRVLLRDHVPWR